MLTLPPRLKRSPHPDQRGKWKIWLFPFAVAIGLRIMLILGYLNIYGLIAGALAVPAILALAKRPALALRLLIIVLPFQLPLVSGLYAVGLAGGLARMLSLWKELAAAALVVAAFVSLTQTPRRMDALDKVALAYVALGTAYMFVPELFGIGLGSTLSLDVRFIGWRTTVLPMLLLVAVRHIRLSSEELAGIVRAAIYVGVALGAIAVFEFAVPSLWNTLMVDTFGVNRFRLEVLNVSIAQLNFQPFDIRTYGEVAGREIVRVGGPMASYLQMSFALLLAAGLMFERVVRGVNARLATVGIVLVGLGILLTQTRSVIVGGVVLAVVVLRPGAGRSETSRVRYTILAGAAALVVVPLVLGSGLSDRFTSGDPVSDQAHDDSFDLAFEVVKHFPLGRGLATGGASGAAEVQGSITAENYFLDVGVQLGWLGIALFVAVLGLVILTLGRSSKGSRDQTVQTGLLGMQNGFIALLVPCWFLHPFNTPEVGWVAFAIAGAALGAADRERSAHGRSDEYLMANG